MTRADKALVLVVIICLPLLYIYTWKDRQAGELVTVWSEKQGKKHYRMDRNAVIHIEGKTGTSRIEINKGRARFIHSPCQGKQCIQHGWVQKNGDFIACLPNRVSVEVSTGKNPFDAVNY